MLLDFVLGGRETERERELWKLKAGRVSDDRHTKAGTWRSRTPSPAADTALSPLESEFTHAPLFIYDSQAVNYSYK